MKQDDSRRARNAAVKRVIDRGLAKVIEVDRDGIVANRRVQFDWHSPNAEDHELVTAAYNACVVSPEERFDSYAEAAKRVLREFDLPTTLGLYYANGEPCDERALLQSLLPPGVQPPEPDCEEDGPTSKFWKQYWKPKLRKRFAEALRARGGTGGLDLPGLAATRGHSANSRAGLAARTLVERERARSAREAGDWDAYGTAVENLGRAAVLAELKAPRWRDKRKKPVSFEDEAMSGMQRRATNRTAGGIANQVRKEQSVDPADRARFALFWRVLDEKPDRTGGQVAYQAAKRTGEPRSTYQGAWERFEKAGRPKA